MLDVSEPLLDTSLQEAESVELPRRKEVWRHLKRSKVGIAGCVITGGFILTAIFGPMLPFLPDATQQDLAARLTPPVFAGGSWDHVLGTDQLGRDLLARVVAGARVSLFVGLSAVAISAVIGVTLGLIAGYRGGLLDSIITSIADIQIAFPGVLAGLVLVTAFGPGVGLVIIVIAMSGWMVFTRVTRGFVFSVKTSLFVEAGELSGARSARIMRVHLLPNLYSSLVTLAVLEFAAAVLSESAFSFLGFGVQPPGTSWGLIIAQGRDYITNAWWIVTFAGCAIALAVLGTNLIALWLQSFGDVSGRERTLLETPGAGA
jgi:peptide/nickel transport system permease protein